MFSREGELISQNPSMVLELLRPTVIVPLVSVGIKTKMCPGVAES